MESATVRIGSTQATSGGTLYNTTMLLHHPLFNDTTNDYDVGVIKVSGEMDLDGTTTRAIKLADSVSEPEPGTIIMVSGWGTTSVRFIEPWLWDFSTSKALNFEFICTNIVLFQEGGEISNSVKGVKIPTISNEECKKTYHDRISPRMFCAGLPEGGKDACQVSYQISRIIMEAGGHFLEYINTVSSVLSGCLFPLNIFSTFNPSI